MAYIRLYHPSDAGEVIDLNLRQADRDELEASSELTVTENIELSLLHSEALWVIVHDLGHIIGIFGLSSTTDTNGDPVGIPWLLTTDELDDFKYAFSKYSMDVVGYMLSQYSYLHNFVDSRNKKAIKWLRWLGFTIHTDEPKTFYNEAVTFYRFSMVRR